MEGNTRGEPGDYNAFTEDTVNIDKHTEGSPSGDTYASRKIDPQSNNNQRASAGNHVGKGPEPTNEPNDNNWELEPEVIIKSPEEKAESKAAVSREMAHEGSVDSMVADPSMEGVINLSEETPRDSDRELLIPVGNLYHSTSDEEGIEHFPEYPPLVPEGMGHDEVRLIPRPFQSEKELKKKLLEYRQTSKDLWNTRRQLPWSMIFQILKLIVITVQVLLVNIICIVLAT